MIEIPLDEVPTELLQRFSRDSELNAQFLRGRATELIADAEWFREKQPGPYPSTTPTCDLRQHQ
jgi:hypothetical protein